MHHALTTIIVAASVIAIVGGAAAGIYYYIAQLPEAPVSALQGKAAEIGYFLSASQDGTVYGVQTGRCTISSVSLDPFNVTLALPEGPSSFPANKTALAVQGVMFSAPPSANYSQGGGARIFSSGNTTYIMPLMRLASVATERELGTTVHLITLSVPSIQQGFSASGTFNMMRRTLGTDRAEYARDVKAGGTAELYVDGAQAASFQVQAGDKVKVVVLYSKIQLAKIG
jgi:hypothetical protein